MVSTVHQAVREPCGTPRVEDPVTGTATVLPKLPHGGFPPSASCQSRR
jgi:hypothetical protein